MKVAGEKPQMTAMKAAAKPQVASGSNGANGHSAEIKVGSRFKYKDGRNGFPAW